MTWDEASCLIITVLVLVMSALSFGSDTCLQIKDVEKLHAWLTRYIAWAESQKGVRNDGRI